MGKAKYLSALEWGMVVGVKNCNAAGFFTLSSFFFVSRMVHHPKDIQPTLHNCGMEALESWASIPVECFQHLVESMPRRIEAVLRTKGGGGVTLF